MVDHRGKQGLEPRPLRPHPYLAAFCLNDGNNSTTPIFSVIQLYLICPMLPDLTLLIAPLTDEDTEGQRGSLFCPGLSQPGPMILTTGHHCLLPA